MCIYQIKFLFYMLPIKYNIIGFKSFNLVVFLIKTGVLVCDASEMKQAIFQPILQHFCQLLLRTIDVSGIIEKFNVFVTLAIIPRAKDIAVSCGYDT